MGEWLLSSKLKPPGMSKRQRVECSCQALRALQFGYWERGTRGDLCPEGGYGISFAINRQNRSSTLDGRTP